MQNDRKITISVGSSRKSTAWAPQVLLLSELYDKLRVPARSTETQAQYLAYPKPQQDDLKDVGGFIGGTLSGPRRKAGCVTGRDVLTVDMDSIPAGGTDDVLRRLGGLGCGFCVYSTRKHRPEAPRLRVVLPVDRTLQADEYEPCARRVAHYIDPGMTPFDPTTFEASRLMYWGSCSLDGEYIYQTADKPMLSVDGLLSTYADWRDVTAWPQVPGAQTAPVRLAAKQGDPTAKGGVVGAFCRVYDVPAAMEAFLPGAYAPAEGQDDRYTYTGGSTTGGAVLYDGGKFLYSHHATDPAGGRLVNAFDLVRLHKFGDLDDEAKPGTLTHQLPSYKAMEQLARADATVASLLAQERGEEILRAFDAVGTGVELGNDLKELLGRLGGEVLTTGVLRQLLQLLGVRVRLNEVTWHVEMSGYPASWTKANAENLLPVLLLDYLRLAKVKGAAKNTIADCLDVVAEENRYNPVTAMFQSAVWDQQDRIRELFALWGVEDVLSRKLVRKWLLQCAAMALNSETDPQGADGVLVLQGEQGIGKTSALRSLVPVPRMFKEGAKLDLRDKDTYMQALNSWICELGELDRTTARDSAGLKAFLTQDLDEYRTPYAKKAVQRPRRTSFCGTVNPKEYLIDDTGNRRFWTVPVTHIDLPGIFALTTEWKVQLWAQVAVEYQLLPSSFRLTGDERRQMEHCNEAHARALDFEDELRDLLNFDLEETLWGEFSAAQIATRLNGQPPANKLGRVLTKLISENPRMGVRIRDGRKLYRLPMLSSCAVSVISGGKMAVEHGGGAQQK